MNKSKNRSYRQILFSTGIFGGAQVINILIGIARNKLIAVILGSVGIGLISIYQSTLDLIKSISTLGIETSGVREVAQAKKDEDDLIITVSAIRKWTMLLAIIGSVICLLASPLISEWTFNTRDYTLEIILLSPCVFFSTLTAGEVILLQGMRKITYIVKSSVISSFLGLVVATILYWIWGMKSIIPVFIIVSIITFICYLYFRQKLNLKTKKVTTQVLVSKGKSMLRIGAYIVIAAIQTQITIFLVKVYIINQSGLDALGLVQATRTISSVYLTLILGAMAADFYPRLSGIINNNIKVRRLVNEQIHVLILISTPVILLLLVLSKFILVLFYTSSFESAVTLLNWRILALFFKIVSWALGIVLLAKGKGFIFLLTDTTYSIIYIIFCYLLFPKYGVDSIGISFLIGYIVYIVLVYWAVFNFNRFRWSSSNLKIGIISVLAITLIFYLSQYQRDYLFYIGIPFCIISICYTVYKLNHIASVKSIVDRITENKKEDL